MMPTQRTTIVLAALCALGLGHVLFFEPRLKTSTERRVAEKRVVQLAASEVHRIKVRRDHWTSALIERSDKQGFRIVEPAAAAAPTRHVLRLLSVLEFLEQRASFNIGQQGGRASDYGLDPPEIEVSVATDKGREIHLVVGKRSAAGDGVYIKVLGKDPISVVDEQLARAANELLDAVIGDADKSREGARGDASGPGRARLLEGARNDAGGPGRDRSLDATTGDAARPPDGGAWP